SVVQHSVPDLGPRRLHLLLSWAAPVKTAAAPSHANGRWRCQDGQQHPSAVRGPSTRRPQPAPAPCPGTFGFSLGPIDGAVPGDTSSAVGSEDGFADGLLPEESESCTVHDGAAPVTLAGVGSKRTQP